VVCGHQLRVNERSIEFWRERVENNPLLQRDEELLYEYERQLSWDNNARLLLMRQWLIQSPDEKRNKIVCKYLIRNERTDNAVNSFFSSPLSLDGLIFADGVVVTRIL
jgi:hypothetical protein